MTMNAPLAPSNVENALARALQTQVPFVERPFAALGEPLGLSEAEVLRVLRTWREDGRLREISAILEGSALGYDSALVAGKVPEARLDAVAEIVNGHPTVTHNYVRGHEYNLWFTIAVPFEIGLERTLEQLARACEVDRFHALRRTHTFKVGVNFDLETRASATEVVPLAAARAVRVGERERSLFRALQAPLALEERPFAGLAAAVGAGEEELLAFARGHLGNAMRRYVGTFRHRRLGVHGNGMVVWRVPEAELPRVGPELAATREVSHCYARNAIPGFPYTLYSMVHGPTEEACREVAAGAAARIGDWERLILFSSRELKKCRLRYFLPELDAWRAPTPRASSSRVSLPAA